MPDTVETLRVDLDATIAAALIAKRLMVAPETGRHRACLVRVPEHGRQRLYHLSSKLLEVGGE
jgi:hypothetical protein